MPSEARYSLWRGDVLLGWFPQQSVPSGDKLVAGAMGYLRLADPSVEIVGVMQTRIGPFPPHIPEMVHQSPQEPRDDARERSRPRAGRDGERVVAMEAVAPVRDTEPPPPGVPPEQLLRIGMPDGSMLNPHLLQIQQFIVPAEHEAEARQQAGVATGPMWEVLFAHHDRSETEAEFAKLSHSSRAIT
jgi:hypothetical protein